MDLKTPQFLSTVIYTFKNKIHISIPPCLPVYVPAKQITNLGTSSSNSYNKSGNNKPVREQNRSCALPGCEYTKPQSTALCMRGYVWKYVCAREQSGAPCSQPVLTALPSACMQGDRLLVSLRQALWRGCVVTGLGGQQEAGLAKWLQKKKTLASAKTWTQYAVDYEFVLNGLYLWSSVRVS